ncbi:MAG: hypothetical protein JXA62_04330 [Candidatus Aminicenantes bacterium]|nr:hypothetical protein [Candidatus Aminicenantes bacterium]
MYRVLFKESAPAGITAAYARACRRLLPKREQHSLDLPPRSRPAVEALEFAWRLADPGNSLTRRMHIMLYLTEANPRHFDTFVPQRSRRLSAWPCLAFHLLRSVGLLVKGVWLRRRYPLA